MYVRSCNAALHQQVEGFMTLREMGTNIGIVLGLVFFLVIVMNTATVLSSTFIPLFVVSAVASLYFLYGGKRTPLEG